MRRVEEKTERDFPVRIRTIPPTFTVHIVKMKMRQSSFGHSRSAFVSFSCQSMPKTTKHHLFCTPAVLRCERVHKPPTRKENKVIRDGVDWFEMERFALAKSNHEMRMMQREDHGEHHWPPRNDYDFYDWVLPRGIARMV